MNEFFNSILAALLLTAFVVAAGAALILLAGSSMAVAGIFVVFALFIVPRIVKRIAREYRLDRDVNKSNSSMTDKEKDLTRQLWGNHTPYAVEAARELGQQNSRAAVPVMISVLERAMAEQRSGWQDISEAIVDAFAMMRDPRSLPVLLRLRSAKGYVAVSELEAAIEAVRGVLPHEQLLRASGMDEAFAGREMLRPALRTEERSEELLQPVSDDAGCEQSGRRGE